MPERDPTHVITTIYPPPSAKDIVQMQYCMNLDKIFLLLATGIICVYSIDGSRQNTTVLEKHYKPGSIKDVNSQPI